MHQSLSRRRLLQGAAATAAAGVLPGGAALARGRRADLIVHNGKVLPMGRHFRIAEAVALGGGEVLAVGRLKELRGLSDRRTSFLDAAGGTVLPGVNDSHLHLNGFGLTFPPFTIDVDTASIAELVARVQTAVAAAGPGDSWIRGRFWNDNRIGRAPTRSDLDPVSGDHPVVLGDFSGHATAVNSKVLQLAGVTRDTVPPPGGVIEKDAAGEPTGVFREGAQNLVRSVVPPFTPEERSRSIDIGIGVLQAEGITSITDPGINLATLALYVDKARSGQLPVRTNILLSAGSSVAGLQATLADYVPPSGFDPLRLRVAGIKVFGDGIPTNARTAWLHEPYLDGTNGRLVTAGSTEAEQLATLHELIRISHEAGFQVGTHATGDAAIDATVDGYLKVMGRGQRRHNPRHYIIHGDLTPPGTLRTMARREIGVNMNATIKFLVGRTNDPFLGPERVDYQWPYRTAIDAGVRVSSSSDAAVTFPSWRQGVLGAVLREGRFGGVAGEAERISVAEALYTYTRTPAFQDHAERWKGSLEPGRVADVCIVGGDVLGVDPHDLVNLPITTTILGGEVVYERTPSARVARAAAKSVLSSARLDHAASCLDGGKCCCKLVDDVVAGKV